MFTYFSNLIFGASNESKNSDQPLAKKRKHNFTSHDENCVSYFEICKMIYTLYNRHYTLIDMKKWYKYEKGSWIPTDNNWIYREKEKIEKKILDKYGNLINLESVDKSRLMEKVYCIFNRSLTDFYTKFDKMKDQIVFPNGVYNTLENKMEKNNRQNYSTRKCRIECLNLEKDDKNMIEVINYFNELIPDEEIRKFFLATLARGLVSNNLEMFFVFQRNPNLEELLLDVMPDILGSYYQLKDSKKEEDANDIIKRMMVWNPTSKEETNSGFWHSIPQYTNDSNNREYTNYVLSREFPVIRNNGYDVWRRLVYFPNNVFQKVETKFDSNWDTALLFVLMSYLPDLSYDVTNFRVPAKLSDAVAKEKRAIENQELQKIAEMRNTKSEYAIDVEVDDEVIKSSILINLDA